MTGGARFRAGSGRESEASAQLRELASIQLSDLLAAQYQSSGFLLRM
jgi:hypothetical protein